MQAGGTILVVEDNAGILELTARMLRLAGYTVLEANHPVDALTIFDQHAAEIVLVLTDVRMPRMNGQDLALKLRARKPELPFLFMSGDKEGSPPGVLLKPFRMPQLWDAVANALKATAAV
ncbi:MAG: sensor protein [Candidatus Solibacter sp.]|jgi:CheY-like chemotaxis protein|nr:sensor protein [Candidatus Solibacter sp.]